MPNVAVITEFIDAYLEENDCPMKAMAQIDVAVDEIAANIASYAYEGTTGYCKVDLVPTEDRPGLFITFEDAGTPFNPLAKEDPDIGLSAAERGVGGLGILIVKKTMDEVTYANENGCNILRLKKYF